MTRNCFGDLGGVRSCWGYRVKVVREQQETKDTLVENVRLFSLKELQKATNNFSRRLGEGGFSSSYKGTLENGSLVWIKVLTHGKDDVNDQGDSDFMSFVSVMSRTRHRNIVEFIGCCLEGDRRMVVYEFVGDRSLAGLLNAKSSEFSWQMRSSICLGVARGLEYLHQGISPSVVHCAIKPSSVLVDDEFNPKIVDFDIAHLFDDVEISAPITGTVGYIDPEYFTSGRFTEKADVYSFGILLLEVITGRYNRQIGTGTTLVSWVWELRESDRVMETVDPSLSDIPNDEVMRFIDVALFCVQLSSDLRPSMSEVLLMLSGGYDFSKKVLRDPWWSSTCDEVTSPYRDQKSGEIYTDMVSCDAVSSVHSSGREEGLVAAANISRTQNRRDSESSGLEILPHLKTDLFKEKFNNVRAFSLAELREATNNFSVQLKIGEGGFGSVYKGSIKPPDGQGEPTLVAVRKLIISDFKALEGWLAVVRILGVTEHPNIIKLIGYCTVEGGGGTQRLLVFEYMPNKSLEYHLFSKSCHTLPWEKRMQIILGAAQGLAYLHEELEVQVILGFLETSSVLLDENFQAKLSDVGLAMVAATSDRIHVSTAVAVKISGYDAPEYIQTGRLTCKSNVWSFGILLYEVLTGRRSIDTSRPETEQRLLDWVKQFPANRKKFRLIMDTHMKNQYSLIVARKIAKLADSCLVKSPKERPTMGQVVKRLKQILKTNDGPIENAVVESDKKPEQIGASKQPTGRVALLTKLGEKAKILDENEITVASSDSDTSAHASGREQRSKAEASIFRRALRRPDFESESETSHARETEIESDLETHSSAPELLHMSHDLEAELYRSIESNTSAAPSRSGPSDKAAVNPGIISASSLDTSSVFHKETVDTTGQMQLSTDLEAESYRSTGANVSLGITVPGPSDAVEGSSFQVQIREQNYVDSLPEVCKTPVQRTVGKILEAFKDAQCKSICLHGLGGSGKTTVLDSLFHHPATTDLFDKVICVTVPRFAYKKQMQYEIVRQLSLNVQDCSSEDEILSQIREALVGGKFLVLLDDVQEIINLREVGIPNPSSDSSCWLVLATRSLNVCRAMADREIKVEVLSTEEAWGMFCRQVGIVIESPEIEPYAQGVAETCHGVPLIISAVANALRAESSVIEWKHALRNLQYADKSNADNQCTWSPHIKYCYDRLNAPDVKTCFLYSALFPEDSDIEIANLVECFVNEGLLGGRAVAGYRRGHAIVKQLIEASLLDANKNGLMVKMPNLIKEYALAILSSDIEGFEVLVRSHLRRTPQSTGERRSEAKLVDALDTCNHMSHMFHKCVTRAGAQLKQPPSLEEWEQATMMFLMDNQLSSLPRNLNCPNLVALFLQRNSCLRVIPSSFFDSMSGLRTLNLSKTRIKSLPDSFYKLKNLQVLLLRDCERFLMLPSSVEYLRSLEVLDLQGTELSHLPDSVCELASLKQLRVSFYGPISHSEYNKLPTKLVSDGIISRLELEELGLFVYPGDQRWISSALEITKEVSRLKLSSLCFYFPYLENLAYFVHESESWKDRDVIAFNFIVGRDFKRTVSLVSHDAECMYSGAERSLRFVNGESIPGVLVEVLKRATSFYLDHHLTVCYLSEFEINSMDTLKICIIRDCPEFVGIVDGQEQRRAFLPALEYLNINYLWNLKKIWVGHFARGSLARLRYLSVHACPKLRYVFTCSMLENLPNLEELMIEDCLSLEYIVIEDENILNDDDVSVVSVEENATVCDYQVLRNLKVLKLHYLPVLSGIWRARWPPLEDISFYNCPELKNLHMEANDDVNIKEIAADKTWWETLHWDDIVVSTRLHNRVTQIRLGDL